jgi:hypothetical protein
LSYSEESEFINWLKNRLFILNYKVLDSSLIKQALTEVSINEIRQSIKPIIKKANTIIICLSTKSIKSITNAIEMNELDLNSSNLNKYIYLMTDVNYTPITNKELNCIVNQRHWFPFYDRRSVLDSMNKIIPILLTCEDI